MTVRPQPVESRPVKPEALPNATVPPPRAAGLASISCWPASAPETVMELPLVVETTAEPAKLTAEARVLEPKVTEIFALPEPLLKASGEPVRL
ncbi:MAG: hypothetical protein BWX70_01488 [Verrucomicrobia bacterium ADurb.Bin070]|nr:MAG: hypothetical protein BWX70_01488 [Verrucomicrobia bacterium ADurb.Bin070]